MEIPGFSHLYSGKVRDLYTPEAPEFQHLVLVVASDRISAFDTVHSPEIPGKGENLTRLTNFWFDRLDVPNHRSDELLVPEIVKDRAMIAKRLDMYPVECVVRGYISPKTPKPHKIEKIETNIIKLILLKSIIKGKYKKFYILIY